VSETTPRLWFLPPVERSGSFRVGFGVGLGLLVVNLAAGLALGPFDQLAIRFALNYSLGVGYSLAVGCAALTSLRQGIDGMEGVDRLSSRGQGLASAVGVAIAALPAALSPMLMQLYPFYWVLVAGNILFWILITPLFFVFARALWRLRRLGKVAEVNLLESRPLAAFGRAAAWIALFGAGNAVIFTLTIFVGRTSGAQAEVPSLVFQTLFLAAALYLPLSGARVGIRAAKQAELDRIAAELGHHGNVLGEVDGPDRVVRLMAYRERIQAVSEWPFGVGTAPRALLYVALPLLSWIAAAMVERSLDVVLE
jgi:hypothetical protein